MPKIQPAAPNDPPTAPSTPMEFRESFLDPDGVDMATRALKNPSADPSALFEARRLTSILDAAGIRDNPRTPEGKTLNKS
jgi:hypothetical protein